MKTAIAALLLAVSANVAAQTLTAEDRLFRAIETAAPDTGCCGMSGAFGLRSETYAASIKIADISLLPIIRLTKPETMIVSNGFSCREQIEGLSGRGTLHLSEALARTLP